MAIPATSITVNDGAATPVSQTFSIFDRTALASAFRNGIASLIRGSQKFVHEVRIGKDKAAANRVIMTLTAPIEGTVDGQVTVVRSHLLKAEINFSPDASEAERQTVYGLFCNLMAQADVKTATQKLVSLG